MPFAPWSISREWEIDTPTALAWEVVSQTDKLNRAIGLPPVEMGMFDGNGPTRRVSARLYGLVPMTWMEYPFEWVRGRGYVVQRDFDSGPFTRLRAGMEVTPVGSRTRVRVHAELTPRNILGRLALPIIGWDMMRKTRTYVRDAIAQALPSGAGASLPGSSSSVPPTEVRPRASSTDVPLLRQRAAALDQIPSLDRRIMARLIRHIAEAGDEDVVRMRPYVLSQQWQTTRSETLRVFLHATRAGLLNLSWELMCPNCRVPKTEKDTLALVTRLFHCETCAITYEANLDRYVELRFRVNPGVRQAKDTVFCFGGPYSAPHVLVQHLLKPGEVRTVTTTLEGEGYRVRVLRLNHAVLLTAAGPSHDRMSPPGTAGLTMTYRGGAWDQTELLFLPGPVTVRWDNQTDAPVGVVLERIRWDDNALTAAEVTALQEFRDLFGSEVLGPGQDIGIETVTVVFSDLKDSTRLYEVAGDAPAYGHVREHFEFVKTRVARHRGATVKTIGDAVMAVFFLPEDAVQCCLEIQRDVAAFNGASPGRQALCVKLGLHHGPAIAINANGQLDYFGRTINLAARIARESEGRDIVMTREVFNDPRVQAIVEGNQLRMSKQWTSTLRGVTEPLTLCRIQREDYNSRS